MTVPATTEGTPFDLLVQVESRLHDKVPDFKPANCFITDEPLPPDAYLPTGKLVCTICLLDGTFDKRLWIGGAGNQLTESSNLVVTILTLNKIDQPPRAKSALLDADRGILTQYKPIVLGALLADDLTADILQPWIPLRTSGEPFLRNGLEPSRSQGPSRIQGNEWLGLSLHFDVEFDWQLRQEIPPSD